MCTPPPYLRKPGDPVVTSGFVDPDEKRQLPPELQTVVDQLAAGWPNPKEPR